MTTSGTDTYNETQSQIIYASARKLGFISFEETLSANAYTAFSNQLNVNIKALDATGLHLWTEEEAILFLQPGQYSYTLGGTTTDNCAWTNYNQTALTNNASQGATSIVVNSATGFAANYYVGVGLNSGAIAWSKESGAPSGTTITLSTPLPGPAAAANYVFVYQTQILRPLRVVSGRRFAFNGQIDTQMIQMSRVDYRNQPNKSNLGVLTQFFYDPRGGSNTQGVMWIWPAPSSVNNALKFTWWRQIQDFSTPGNNPDLPQEWLDFLIWSLAEKMAAEADCPAERYAMIKEQASAAFDVVSGFDREPESYLFGYDADQTGPP
jgi:hypothetical protein